MISPQIIWDDVLGRLKRELPASTVDVWLRPLVPEGDPTAQTDELRLVCPSTFHRDRVRERFLSRIAAHAAHGSSTAVRVELVVAVSPADLSTAADQTHSASPAPGRARPAKPSSAGRIDPTRARRRSASARVHQQSFENFIVGPCNALAREACLAIVRNDSQSLNPLYLAAGSGLGKTHLARSVVRETARAEGARVVFTSAEGFTNEFTKAIRNRDTTAFKRRFRNGCDVLVVDDVGFLGGKTQTQLELFHSIQHVLDSGGRVLVTGDRLPRSLSGMEDRVRSQLASGLVAELTEPSAAVRREILRSKADAGGVRLPTDCLDLLLARVPGGGAALEGVLIQLVNTASLLKRPIDLDLTREAIAQKCGDPSSEARRLDVKTVIGVVSSFFKTTPTVLASRSRRRTVLVPRQLAMYLCRRYTDASLAEIGRTLGRDHPAVNNAVARVEREILERAPMRYQVEALCGRLDELTTATSSA